MMKRWRALISAFRADECGGPVAVGALKRFPTLSENALARLVLWARPSNAARCSHSYLMRHRRRRYRPHPLIGGRRPQHERIPRMPRHDLQPDRQPLAVEPAG